MLAGTNSGLDNVCSGPAETLFYFENFSQMDESVNVNEESSTGEKHGAEDFVEDKEDHYNIAELAEEHEKTEEKEKQIKPKKGRC